MARVKSILRGLWQFLATCSFHNGVELSETNSRHWSHGYLLFYEQLQ